VRHNDRDRHGDSSAYNAGYNSNGRFLAETSDRVLGMISSKLSRWWRSLQTYASLSANALGLDPRYIADLRHLRATIRTYPTRNLQDHPTGQFDYGTLSSNFRLKSSGIC